MNNTIHHGVGLLIGNSQQSRFFIQQKDEQYPFEQWRGAYSFWGGAMEEEDTHEQAAVERELKEEIPEAALLLANVPKVKIDQYWVNSPHLKQPFWLSLFEAVVSDDLLDQIATTTVLEGNGILIETVQLHQKKWIWDMDFIFKEYLNIKQNP